MFTIISLIARAGAALHPLTALALVILINAQWVLTLQAFGALFERQAGALLLDLANVPTVLSPSAALELIGDYSAADIALYWTFYAMDNVVPLLSFGTYALLWASLLHRSGFAWGRRLGQSGLLLIPFGVGGFDIIENSFFISALASGSPDERLALLGWGLVFVQAKAAALLGTFALTPVVIVVAIVGGVRAAQRRRTSEVTREATVEDDALAPGSPR